jgi:hypothetical protein
LAGRFSWHRKERNVYPFALRIRHCEPCDFVGVSLRYENDCSIRQTQFIQICSKEGVSGSSLDRLPVLVDISGVKSDPGSGSH